MRLSRGNEMNNCRALQTVQEWWVRGGRLKQDLDRVKFIQSTGSPLRFGKLQL